MTSLGANPFTDTYFTNVNTSCPLKAYRISHLDLAEGKGNMTKEDWASQVVMDSKANITIAKYSGVDIAKFTGVKVMV